MPGKDGRGRSYVSGRGQKHEGGAGASLLYQGGAPELVCFRFEASQSSQSLPTPFSPLPDPSDQSKNVLFRRVTPHYEKPPDWVLLTKSHSPTNQGYCFFIQSPSNLPSLCMVFAVSGNRPSTATAGSYLR